MNAVTRVFEFDSAHRVMNERVKCFNLHGHRFRVELSFVFEEVAEIGYAIDFKEIKRIAGAWLDENFDHAAILNPKDHEVIDLCKKNNWRIYIMGLGKDEDVNPTAENISEEILYCLRRVFMANFSDKVVLVNVRLFETPNCWVDTSSTKMKATKEIEAQIFMWAKEKGVVNYDSRYAET